MKGVSSRFAPIKVLTATATVSVQSLSLPNTRKFLGGLAGGGEGVEKGDFSVVYKNTKLKTFCRSGSWHCFDTSRHFTGSGMVISPEWTTANYLQLPTESLSYQELDAVDTFTGCKLFPQLAAAEGVDSMPVQELCITLGTELEYVMRSIFTTVQVVFKIAMIT